MKNLAYSVYGLQVRSQLPLPELTCVQMSVEPDVEIELGSVETPAVPGFTKVGEDLVFNVPGVARYLIRAGREVIVALAPEASERHARVFLLGSVLGALLQQRGHLPLHANAVEVDGRAIAFMGPSGSGKSTLAAAFNDNGYRVLADDVCSVRIGADGEAFVDPGVPRLRLWRDTLEATGRAVADHEPSWGTADKFDVIPANIGTKRIKLRAAYVFDATVKARPKRLCGLDAVEALVANTYRGQLLRLTGGAMQHLNLCAAVASRAPVFALKNDRKIDSLADQVTRLVRHCF